jgi:L-rhamnose 1-dehydrogenase
MVAATLEHFGTVDILVNNAGICPFEEFLKMSEQLWDRVHDVNLKGVFLCSQAVARVMVEKKIPGRIICTSSISSTLGGPLQAHYCPTKAGVNLFVKSIAIALGPYGITCNAVAPGPVVTDINRELFGAKSELFEKIVARSPLGRLGTPADIAGPMVFFASDDAAYCTGSILVVDGGIMVNLG